MNTVVLWLLRKALYVSAGTVLSVLAMNLASAGGPNYNLTTLTIAGVISGLGTAVVGDLRRAFAADLLQIASGEDPRKDG